MTVDSAAIATPPRGWRVVDIVTAAVLAVVGALLILVWNNTGGGGVVTGALDALTPGLSGLMLGGWLLPGIVGGLVIRKPGAALLVELLAATLEMAFGSQWGWTAVVSGVAQGLGFEAVLLLFAYRRFGAVVAALAGVASAAVEWVAELFLFANLAKSMTFKAVNLTSMLLSGAVAGLLGWALVRALARTGALDRFAAGHRAADR